MDAVVTDSDGVVHRGDIELHVRRPDWYSHGHDQNPGYNGLIFRVTGLEEDDEVQARSGVRIPFLLLKSEAKRGGHLVRPSVELPKLSLDEAGDRRFFARSARLKLDLATTDADQVLRTEVLECLDYSKIGSCSGSSQRGFRGECWPTYPVRGQAILALCCGKEPDLTLRAAAGAPD